MPITHRQHPLLRSAVAFLVPVLFALSGCGGAADPRAGNIIGNVNGGGSGNNGFGVTVTVDGSIAAPVNDSFQLPAESTVVITCSAACTFETAAVNEATISEEVRDSTSWSANVSLPQIVSRYTVTAAAGAGDSSPVSVVLTR